MKSNKIEDLKERFNNFPSFHQTLKEDIGLKLLQFRKEAGYTQQEVADCIGISRAALAYYEKGERGLDVETLYKLCSIYNVSIDYLFGLKETPEPQMSYEETSSLKEIGLSEESMRALWGNPDFADLINGIVQHPDFTRLEHLTYHSRYTQYEEYDNKYRSFLTSQLLYSMMSDIFESWYINNPDRTNTLSAEEKSKLISDIENYFSKKENRKPLRTLDEWGYTEEMEKELELLHQKLKKYL